MTRFILGTLILLFTNISYPQNNIKYIELLEKSLTISNWYFCEEVNSNCFDYSSIDVWKELEYSKHSKYLDLPKAEYYWLQSTITLQDDVPEGSNLSIIIYTPGSANEIYWDSTLINKNGLIGESLKTEIPGKVIQEIKLSQDLIIAGDHKLSIQVSNYHQVNSKIKNLATIGDINSNNQSISTRNYWIIIIASVFFTSAVFSLIFYFGFNKNLAYVFFSFFSLTFTIKTLLEAVTLYPDMDVTNFNIQMSFVYPVVLFGGILLIAFLSYKFSLHRKKEIFIYFLLFSLISYLVIPMRYYIVAMIAVAIALVLYTSYKRLDGSLLSLTGLIGFSFLTYLGYRDLMNYGYFAGVIFFIFCIMISLARQISKQNQMHNQALIRASRLESQLLKKNIQPHFILNSLTSLQELIERSPQKAIELIDSLSEEFRTISKISGEKLIPISDELTICNAHLKIMEFRKESNFKFETENIDEDEMVPPALFHTLVENGITHGYGSKKAGYFLLTKEILDNGIRYKLFNDSESADDITNKKGTGLRYIEARLEESYPGCWNFEHHRVDSGWIAVVDIYNSKRRNNGHNNENINS